ncbi:MAG: antitoxin component YwqK of YwqJK toxin-antitoxin module [Saprospiraceae bacterium]|jgi:antitoxin component YwqK of YwqJK toxin-antitoxin module
MKIQLSFFLAIISAMLITACGGGGASQPIPADLAGYIVNDLKGTNAAVAQKFNPTGLLIENGYLIGGNKSGQWSTYDTDGRISSVVNYIEGKKNGEELKLNSRGMLEGRNSYKNNSLDGLSGTYKNGRPVQEISYKNGQFDGATKKYFKNGKIQQEINFKKGKQHGVFKYFNEEGDVTLEYMYKNGEKVSGGIVEK